MRANGTSSHSSDEEFELAVDANSQNEEYLKEYLHQAFGKRMGAPATAHICCFNCTQKTHFAGLCPSCGHPHDFDAQLISMPLEYSRSAYVHMRQQRMRQQLQQQQEAAWLQRQQQQQQQEQEQEALGQQQQQPAHTTSQAPTPASAALAAYIQQARAELDPLAAHSHQPTSSTSGVTPPSQQPPTSQAPPLKAAPTSPIDQLAVCIQQAALAQQAHGTSAPAASSPASSPPPAAPAPAPAPSLPRSTAPTLAAAASASASSSSGRQQHASAPVLLAWDDRTNLHHNGAREPHEEVAGLRVQAHMHPERPARTQAIVAQLYRSGLLDRCQALPARHASEDELLRCHSAELVAGVAALSASAAQWSAEAPEHTLDVGGDTYANRHTWEAATLAAGMAIDVALGVASGQGSHGAAVIRPPGHHAESSGVMGFCFLNHAVLAARAVQRVAGVERVAVVDWDVHHGNGAQHMLWEDPSVLTISLHRHDGGNYFPGSGAMEEVGGGPGEGSVLNVPWPMPGMGDAEYVAAFDQLVQPVLREFDPQLIIVSAGFDSAAADPLGGCSLSSNGFARMTQQLKDVAPVVLLLEGGYNLLATAAGFEACLRVLLGEEPSSDESDAAPPAFVALQTLSAALRVQSRYWDCLQPLTTRQLMGAYQWLGATDIIRSILENAGHDSHSAAQHAARAVAQ